MNHRFVPLCPQGHDGVVTLCRYPFVFDAQAKTTLLQADAVIQMQVICSAALDEGIFLSFVSLRLVLLIIAGGQL